jgi:hypothetical protein
MGPASQTSQYGSVVLVSNLVITWFLERGPRITTLPCGEYRECDPDIAQYEVCFPGLSFTGHLLFVSSV